MSPRHPLWRALLVSLALACMPAAFAQACAQESEPNDTPAQATSIDDATCLVGTFEADDQDAWWWEVDEEMAARSWQLEVESIPGQVTKVDLMRIEFAADGVGVTSADTLLGFGTADGRSNRSEAFHVAPGRYLLALSKSGGEGGYVVHLRGGDALSRGRGRFETPSTTNAFARAGVLGGERSFEWQVDEEGASVRWELAAQGAVGEPLRLELLGPSGDRVARAEADHYGRASLTSLGLQVGGHRIVLDGTGPATLDVAGRGRITDGDEIEPNDRWEEANVFTFDRPLRGTGTNVDHFVFDVGPDRAGRPWDLRVEASANIDVELFDRARESLQRRRGAGGVLRGLTFEEGTYGLTVRHDDAGAYTLAFEPGAPLQDGFEREPNDTLASLDRLGPELTVRGELTRQDRDTFRFSVEGQPQAWRVQAIGEGVSELAVFSGGGVEIQRTSGEGRLRIDQLVLNPGEHVVQVRGESGAYALRLLALGPAPTPPEPDLSAEAAETPLTAAAAPPATPEALPGTEPALPPADPGPPPPAGQLETEPNDDASRAELLAFGTVRVGTIPSSRDTDVYRFQLAEDQVVRLELVPPDGGGHFMDLIEVGARTRPVDAGEVARIERHLLAGPYELRVRDRDGAGGYYQLRLVPLDPLARPVDREPNDEPESASPVPFDLVMEGSVGETSDADFYRLPPFDRPTELRIDATLDERAALALFADTTTTLRPVDEGGYVVDVPAGGPHHLRVSGQGAYRLALTFADPPDPTHLAPPAGDPQAELAFDVPLGAVQAFGVDGQFVTRTLTVRNDADSARTFAVETASNHPLSALEAPETVSVPARGSADVPVTARLAPDLRDDQPVRLTIGLRDDLGLATSTATFAATCEAPALGAGPVWPLPEPLLGRLDVAWSGLGARPVDPSGRAEVAFDGRATPSTSVIRSAEEPLDVELAGSGPIRLTGTTLHPLSNGRVADQLRRFEVWTSLDGETYERVLAAELRAARVAQPFTFDAPVTARFARLVFLDSQRGDARAYLGAWQLIADETTDLGRLNLADPAVGGHVVWSDPLLPRAAAVLDAEQRSSWNGATQEAKWVMGFHHGRAAQVEEIEWVAPSEAPGNPFTEVTVFASLAGPIGPWTELGTFPVAATGTSAWSLADAPWVRYLRFDARGHDPAVRTLAPPDVLRVWERPASADYRSALGAWGFDTSEATFEHAVGRPAAPTPDDEADDDTAATARAVASGTTATGTVAVGEDVDWLRVNVPDGENLIELRLSGDPAVRYAFVDEEGAAVTHDLVQEGTSRVLRAFVEPGDYLLRLDEPKRSVVFSWDTSGSVSPYTPITYASLGRFVRDVDPDRESVQLLAYDDPAPRWLLPTWSADPLRVAEALNDFDRSADSSNSYTALLAAARALEQREGVRALLLITDAETPSYDLSTELWRAFERGQPRVFTFEISSGGSNAAQDLMQDWAAVADGRYALAGDVGDFDAGFARASCLLRRPKAYRVEVTTATETPPGPGTLRVVRGEGAAQPAVEVIFDASGSMGSKLASGESRIDVAKAVLRDFVATGLPEGTPFALRAFGHITPNSCETRLDVPLAPLERARVLGAIDAIEPKLFSQTPIAASLAAVAEDLAGAAGPKAVLLLTDGLESCDGDPQAAIEDLRAAGVDVQLAIVSLGLQDPADVAAFEALAAAVGASYVGADDAAGLRDAVLASLAVPYAVLGADGTVLATGEVDGDPIELPAGVYRVRIGTGATEEIDVRVPGDGAVEVTATR
jgi:hypothetical protein